MSLDQIRHPLFLRYDSLPSTSSEALSQARQGAAEGVCVTAREQSAGRGRQDRVWCSPRDAGLYLSIILRPRLAYDQWPLLTLMTAVAVHEALKQSFDLTTDIKWPNDLMASEKKLGGILAETTDSISGRAAVVGIGVNLAPAAVPIELRTSATAVRTEVEGPPVDEAVVSEFAHTLVRMLWQWYDVLRGEHGGARIIAAWCERSSYAQGKPVSVVTGGELLTGVTAGLTEAGALRLTTEDGDTRILHSAEVTHLRQDENG